MSDFMLDARYAAGYAERGTFAENDAATNDWVEAYRREVPAGRPHPRGLTSRDIDRLDLLRKFATAA